MLRRYDYRCPECGYTGEYREDMDAAHAHPCPECGTQMRRKPSAVGVVYRTGGFYSVDHRKGGTE